MDSVVRGGTLATASATFQADIGIEGGKVVALGQQFEAGGAQEIDARGCLVVPGAVDVHTHVLPRAALRKGMYVIVTCQSVGGRLQAVTVHIEYRHPRPRRKRS